MSRQQLLIIGGEALVLLAFGAILVALRKIAPIPVTREVGTWRSGWIGAVIDAVVRLARR